MIHYRWSLLTLASLYAAPATGQSILPEGVDVEGRYVADVIGVVSGGEQRGARILDNLDLTGEADLGTILGWTGARFGMHLLANQGETPNALAGTIQGIDNIEVEDHRTKIFQLWFEQSLAGDRLNLRVGLSDLNAEFYQTEAAGDLIAPAFGIGSELAASGPNGPSIFPSAALMARLRVAPTDDSFVQAAVVNAKAGVIGDAEGVDLSGRDGALLIGEAGWTGRGKIAAAYWRYTQAQPVFPEAANETARAQGAYVLVEQPLSTDESGPTPSAFLRIGFSDAKTTPFRGGWQAGLRIERIFSARPEGALSIGINRGLLSRRFRELAATDGERLASAETGFEITYSDRVLPFLWVQPDLQYIVHPSGDRSIPNAVVVGLRIVLAYAS